MAEHILFLTGKLAEPSLRKVLHAMQPTEFSYDVCELGISVAGLMTSDMIRRRLVDIHNASRIVIPGRARGDLDPLCEHYGVPVVRGPDELKDLPQFFGRAGEKPDLSRYDIRIFAEIVEAPTLTVAGLLARAAYYRACGADVIDLGALPQTPFPHLEDAVAALVEAGYQVSVDSHDTEELLRGGRAGAHYLLSLKEETLWVADQVAAVPVVIPSEAGDIDSLVRSVRALQSRGRPCIADSILDPIHFGFTDAIVRYRELRNVLPETEIMMGIGNLTELTDADTAGMNALLIGIASELGITNILATEVSPHARSAVREADFARRMMFAARANSALPRDIGDQLMALHERRPFPYAAAEIGEFADAVKDPSFRIQVSSTGMHVYNRDGMQVGTDPFEFYPGLKVDQDGSHAFYLGVELGRAQIAWQLGKRYTQDQPLGWGCAAGDGTDTDGARCGPESGLSQETHKPTTGRR
ncbi:MAG: dihydropteroate synthase [Betaproteobacteria bacterium]|nr:dihydropteroate synthase [Betaproteobacteria bacterium]